MDAAVLPKPDTSANCSTHNSRQNNCTLLYELPQHQPISESRYRPRIVATNADENSRSQLVSLGFPHRWPIPLRQLFLHVQVREIHDCLPALSHCSVPGNVP